MTAEQVEAFERCVREGGVCMFPADTVYGLACDPRSAAAIERMYALKGRRPDKPSAVMFFSLELALEALPEIGEATKRALRRLLPGPVTVVVPNPAGRFPLAAGPGKQGLEPGSPAAPPGLGLRVPRLEGPLAPLSTAQVAVLQTSANPTGGPDPRRLEDVPERIRAPVDLVLDGGELSGKPSTVVDLSGYERDRSWSILREATLSREQVRILLAQGP